MNCPKCHSYISGDFCLICNHVIFEKKKPITKIKKVSAKRESEELVYKAKRIKFLKENPRCAVYPHLESTQCHHSAGRNGSAYLDESTWYAVSFEGHNWIHNNDTEAREKGFLVTRSK